jgi:hypothetical protein
VLEDVGCDNHIEVITNPVGDPVLEVGGHECIDTAVAHGCMLLDVHVGDFVPVH